MGNNAGRHAGSTRNKVQWQAGRWQEGTGRTVVGLNWQAGGEISVGPKPWSQRRNVCIVKCVEQVTVVLNVWRVKTNAVIMRGRRSAGNRNCGRAW